MVREHIVIRNSLEGVNREPLTSYLMHAYCYDGECCFSFNNNRYTMYAGDCIIHVFDATLINGNPTQ